MTGLPVRNTSPGAALVGRPGYATADLNQSGVVLRVLGMQDVRRFGQFRLVIVNEQGMTDLKCQCFADHIERSLQRLAQGGRGVRNDRHHVFQAGLPSGIVGSLRRLLLIAQIPGGTDEASEPLLRIQTRQSAISNPAIAAILVTHAIFKLEVAFLIEGSVICLRYAITIIRVHYLKPSVPQLIFERHPGELQPLAVEKCAAFVWTRRPDQHRGRISQRAKFLIEDLRMGRIHFLCGDFPMENEGVRTELPERPNNLAVPAKRVKAWVYVLALELLAVSVQYSLNARPHFFQSLFRRSGSAERKVAGTHRVPRRTGRLLLMSKLVPGRVDGDNLARPIDDYAWVWQCLNEGLQQAEICVRRCGGGVHFSLST